MLFRRYAVSGPAISWTRGGSGGYRAQSVVSASVNKNAAQVSCLTPAFRMLPTSRCSGLDVGQEVVIGYM